MSRSLSPENKPVTLAPLQRHLRVTEMLLQTATVPTNHCKQCVYLLTVITTLLMTGCHDGNGDNAVSLIHPSSVVEEQPAVEDSPAPAQPSPTQQPPTLPSPAQPSPTLPFPTQPSPMLPSPAPETPADTPTPINPQIESLSGLTSLKTQLTFELTFNNTPTILFETLDLSQAAIETFDGLQILSSEFAGGAIACAEPSRDNYLCIRMFEDRSYLIETFVFSEHFLGSGLFEYCPVNIDTDYCGRNFQSSPDGRLAVTTRAQLTPLAVGPERIQLEGGVYMQYMKQGEIEMGGGGSILEPDNKITQLHRQLTP